MTQKVKVPIRIVSAPVAGGAYPAKHRGATLTHAVELDSRGRLIGVLCTRVSLESILDDASQFNLKPVDCMSCMRAVRKLAI